MKKLVLVMSLAVSFSSFAQDASFKCQTDLSNKISKLPQIEKAYVKVEKQIQAGTATLAELNDLLTLVEQTSFHFCEVLTKKK